MLPIPQRSALFIFLAGITCSAIGIALSAHVAIILGSALLIALGVAIALTMPLARRVRAQRLEFAWWVDSSDALTMSGVVTPSTPFRVRCYVRHRGDEVLTAASAEPLAPNGVRVLTEPHLALRITPRARTEFAFRLVSPAAGRVVLHGLSVTLRGPLGLFAVPLYFPNPLTIKVLPRAAATTRIGMRAGLGERSGRTQLRRRGGGTDLHELRDLAPGDPFKSIAWKASARYGRLLVKEVEREVQETRWIVIDISGTMRGGELGGRKIDFAIEAAASAAKRALDHGDRVGLATVDGRVLSHVPPAEGTAQMLRIYEALIAATEVVDGDLTDTTDAEVTAIVARYVRHQDGIDFRRTDGTDVWDVPALTLHVERLLRQEGRPPFVETHESITLFRYFCRLRGIPLPYRPDPRDGRKAPGLAQALKLAGDNRRVPASIVVITDFDGIGDTDPLMSAVKLMRIHQHRLAFVVPDAVSFAQRPEKQLDRDLFQIYSRSEGRRATEARALLGRAGVPVLVATRDVPPALAIERACMMRRVA